MTRHRTTAAVALTGLLLPAAAQAAESFPRAVGSYADPAGAGVWEVLRQRAAAEPFNLVATGIFALAVVHTFLTGRFRHWAHQVEERHRARAGGGEGASFAGQVLHFLGEVEAVFGLWVVALVVAIGAMKGTTPAIDYLGRQVDFTEAVFVVVIMALASTRPVMGLAQAGLRYVAGLGGGSPAAWWFSILTVAPLLGAFITEPAAMTIGALLLSRHFYAREPGLRLRYATLGLLFVNVSVGGTLTHFAAPPVLMVANAWHWGLAHMAGHFGWRAALGIVAANGAAFLVFRRELGALTGASGPEGEEAEEAPGWVTAVHLSFLGFTVWMAHYPAIVIGGFLFYLAFAQATAHHQRQLDMRGPLLVGFFLAGLVVHGGLQAWWIEPVLGRLGELPLFGGAVVLTAFNDNALITYLATHVPSLSDPLKQAVVAGAVVGGGLTVIANAPNPAGQSLLQQHFPEGISPFGLLRGALPPTFIMAAVFLLT